MGKLFGVIGWSDVITGVASSVGMAFGGPPGAMLLGGAAGTITALTIDHQHLGDALKSGAWSAAMSFFPGGPLAGAERGLIAGGAGNALRSLRALGSNSMVERSILRHTHEAVDITSTRASFLARRALVNGAVHRRFIGSVASGLSGMTAHGIATMDSGEDDPGYRSIPTKPLAYSSNLPAGISQVERPDNDEMKRLNYPDKYRMNDGFWADYPKIVLPIFEIPYKTAGQGLKTVPTVGPAPHFKPNAAALKMWGNTSTNYQDMVMAMNKSLDALVAKDNAVLPLVQETGDIVDGYKKDLAQAVVDLNDAAGTAPDQSTIEDFHVMEYINQSTANVTDLTESVRQEIAAKAAGLKPADTQTGAPDPAIQQLQDNNKAQQDKLDQQDAQIKQMQADLLKAGQGAPNTNPQNNGLDTNAGGLDGVFGKNQSVQDAAAANSNSPDLTGQTGAANNPSGTSNIPSPSPAPANVADIPSTGGGMGLESLSSMLPLLLANRTNDDYGNRFDDMNPERYDRNQQPLLPIQATPPLSTPQTPSVAPAPAATPNAPAQAAPANNTPAPAAPARVPGPNEAVSFTFPDGVTQMVSYTVKQALTAAFADHSGTDAQAAYAATNAKWTDNKQIGKSIDPNEAMTGDVALWQNPERAALIRVLGSAADGTIDVIIAGQLRPLQEVLDGGSSVFDKASSGAKGDVGAPALPQVTDNGGVSAPPTGVSAPSGDTDAARTTGFAGFAHPHGIEVSNVSAQDSGGNVPAGGDPATGAPADTTAVPVS